MTRWMASIVRWSTLSVALLLPAVAHPESRARIVGIDTEHIFGFTEGTDIGDKGDIELESTFIGRFGKPGSFAALQNETAVRYGITDTFRLAVGTLFDYRSIYNVPGLDDYSGFNFAGLTAEARWQVLRRDSSPIGLTLSATPQWRRVDDLSVPPVESYSVVLTLLADAALISDTTFAAVNVTSAPTSTRVAGVWQQDTPLEASAAVSHAIAPGLFLGAEVRHLTHNRDGFFTGHALFIGPSLFVKMTESTVIKAAWSIQVPDETSGGVDLVNYERHQVLLLLVKNSSRFGPSASVAGSSSLSLHAVKVASPSAFDFGMIV